MTSRESTSFWPRAGEGADAAITIGERAAVGAFALIQWPWLLKSLSGGRRSDKRALLARLGLPADALPNLGSWKADTALLTLIADVVERERPQVVVELGCGASTLIVARALAMAGGGRHVACDNHAEFAAKTRDWLADHGLAADIRHAPLSREASGDWPGAFYEIAGLPKGIDLLIVDGPVWTRHPLVRGAAETLFDALSPGATILLDDGARPGERIAARRWKKNWPDIDFALVRRGTKGTLVGKKRV